MTGTALSVSSKPSSGASSTSCNFGGVASNCYSVESKQKRVFLVEFKEEDGVDEGGLYNELFDEITRELLNNDKLTLFIRTENNIHEEGPEQYLFKTNPIFMKESELEMYEFVGALIAIALRTDVTMAFNLPSLFWKFMVQEQADLEDLERIDIRAIQYCKKVAQCKEEEFSEFADKNWTVLVSEKDNIVYDLISNGSNIFLTWERRQEYVDKIIQYELHKKDFPQLSAIKKGFGHIIPPAYLSMFTWKELEVAVCGDPVNIEELKKNAIYEDVSSDEPHILFFWRVLEGFSAEEQEKFLQFSWARSRMPPSGINQGITISAPPSESREIPDHYHPRSNTCHFKIHLPRYTNFESAKEKILYAISHCKELDRI